MKKTGAFFRLIRWPNLIVISITQLMFYFIIFRKVYLLSGEPVRQIQLQPGLFFLLLLSSLLIAAGGYIINDYLDTDIDAINKPSKVIIGRHMSQSKAILFYILFTLSGIFISAWVSYRLQNFGIVLMNSLASFLLLFYSTTLKRKLLAGNIIISLLTAWVIMVLVLAEYPPGLPSDQKWNLLLKYSVIYSAFAFLLTMVREIIKDMEDVKGDAILGCKTLPIVWGTRTARIIPGILIVILSTGVAFICINLFISGWWYPGIYGILTVILPLGYILKKLLHATSPDEYHKLSNQVKVVMLAGIFSMFFFLI